MNDTDLPQPSLLLIAYASTLKPGGDTTLLDQILTASQRNNDAQDITGCLGIEGRNIIQIIEGPPAAVEALFEVIRADPRHEGIVLLHRQERQERLFPGWRMVRRPTTDLYLFLENAKVQPFRT